MEPHATAEKKDYSVLLILILVVIIITALVLCPDNQGMQLRDINLLGFLFG